MPSLRITVDVFSGRENPVIELKGAEARDALHRLRPVRKLGKGDVGLPPAPTLGYRGLVVERLGGRAGKLPKVFRYAHGDLFGPKFACRAADEAFEDFVCGTTGPIRRLKLGPKLPFDLRLEIERFRTLRLQWPLTGTIVWPVFNPCRCAPLYEPAWWNVSPIQGSNNCYNYGTNYRTDTFAQPGRASGAMYASLTCAAVKAGAVADGLIDSPTADNKCPKEGHLVALVVWPNGDFHWYRKGRNGYWSHKPGGTAVTNLDNSGATISDPRTADRGPYTSFCTFMTVMHGHVKLK